MMGKREKRKRGIAKLGRIQRALETNERWLAGSIIGNTVGLNNPHAVDPCTPVYEAIRTLETLKRNLEVEQAEEEEHWF